MNKRILTLVFLPLLLSACANNSEDTQIKKTAYNYLSAMGNYKIAAAEKYADNETRTITLQFFERKMMPYLDSTYLKSNTPAEITIKEIEIIDDSNALVKYHKSTPITEQDGELQMRKVDDAWKAHVVIKIPDIFLLDNDEMRTNIEKMESMNGEEINLQVYDGPNPQKRLQTSTTQQ